MIKPESKNVGSVFVVMSEINDYKNICEVFDNEESAQRYKAYLEQGLFYDVVYVLDMPLFN